ncbi:MAG: type VI secretion system baseplate subunit TssF, partial [Planctomycetaceae bacterium]
MTDELLPYYNRELSFIRKMGAEFAAAHPKIAGRLRLGTETAEDPHVSRMIESFALLAARVRHKIEDDFPEITEALLGVLYPHYLAPVPSMAIVQFVLDEAEAEAAQGHRIERGRRIETQPIDGNPVRFRTCFPVHLWPVRVKEATLRSHPFTAPRNRFSTDAAAVLRLVIECDSDQMTFKELELDRLRFFLRGQSQYVAELYETLLNHTLGIAIAAGETDRAAVLLENDALRPVGFERDEGMLPYPAASLLGYRLLTEFFAFSEKFQFVELD